MELLLLVVPVPVEAGAAVTALVECGQHVLASYDAAAAANATARAGSASAGRLPRASCVARAAKRDAAADTLPEWEALRDEAAGIKRDVLGRLPELWRRFEQEATAAGAAPPRGEPLRGLFALAAAAAAAAATAGLSGRGGRGCAAGTAGPTFFPNSELERIFLTNF